MTAGLITILIAVSLVPSLLISVLAVAFVRRAAERFGLLDKPGARKVHTTPIPLGGGLGIWAGVVGTIAMGTSVVLIVANNKWAADLLPADVARYAPGLVGKCGEIWFLIGCGTVLMLLGLVDDRRGLPWQLRIGIEFLVATVCVYGQGLQLTAFIELPWLTGILSVLWIVALINSFNMLDNMDALSGGVATISAGFLAAMLLSSPDPQSNQPQIFVAAMLLMLAGGLLGFLVHNWPPAKIFMGDAGSYFVGFWIAVATLLATYAGYQGGTPQAVIAPLCVLAVPLYDMTSVILIRLREGRSPFQGDKRHFSHRLVDLGMTKKQAVLTIYLTTATCSIGALLLPLVSWTGAVLIIVNVVLVLSLVAVLESVRKKS